MDGSPVCGFQKPHYGITDAGGGDRSLNQSLLPRISIADRIEAGQLKALAIDKPKLRRRILLATSPAHQPSETVRALASFARRHSVEWFRAPAIAE